MADNENPTVGAEAESGAGQVSQEQQATIDGETAKLLELLEGKFSERFSELTKNFTGQLEGLKKVQGEIDRSQNTFRQQLAALKQYQAAGLSEEEALAEMEEDSKANDWRSGIEGQLKTIMTLLQGGANPTLQQSVAKVFEKYGLDPKDPNVAPALAKQYKSLEEADTAALKVFYQIHSAPNPNPAQSAALNGGEGRRDSKDISQITDSSTLYDLAANNIVGGK